MTSSPPWGKDPGVRSHGMEAHPPGYLWSKYECFLMSGWWDLLHSSCLHVKLWSNSMNGTEVPTNEQTYEWKDENYIPLGKNGQYYEFSWFCSFGYHFASFKTQQVFLACPTEISVNQTRARKCRLTWRGVRGLSCMTSIWQFWCFDIISDVIFTSVSANRFDVNV